jgi:diaminopimelate decarboxylase
LQQNDDFQGRKLEHKMLEAGVVDAVVEKFGTPCYIYDERSILNSLSRFESIPYSNKSIHFATMANNNPQLLALIRERGLKVFVNSAKHLALARTGGFDYADIIYTATGVTEHTLRHLIQRGVEINIDSLPQLEMFGRLTQELNGRRAVGIRVNIAENTRGDVFSGEESRIGIYTSQFPDVHRVAASFGLTISGVHVYLGTDIADYTYLLTGTEQILSVAEAFPDLEYVDLGGGFPTEGMHGVNFDYQSYGRKVSEIFVKYSEKFGRSIKLILEPGRALFGDSAIFCTRVVDLKDRPDRLIIGCDASVSLFPRPLMYDEYHSVYANGKADSTPLAKRADVVGSTTYSRDYLAKNVALPAVDVEDILCFEHAGSYCFALTTQFLGQFTPAEILIREDGEFEVIRDREEESRPAASELERI